MKKSPEICVNLWTIRDLNSRLEVFRSTRRSTSEEWVLLHSPIDEDSPEKSFAALARHLRKGVRPPRLWRADPNRLVFKVRHWTDADTVIFYMPSHVAKLYVVTLKFDLEGKCKVTSAQKIAKKEIED